MKSIYLFIIMAFACTQSETVRRTDPPELIMYDDTTQVSIFDIARQLSEYYDIPFELVDTVGDNESGWVNPYDMNYIHKCEFPGESSWGDLQIWDPTWEHWSKKLGLTEKTRINLLHVGIRYLKYQHDRYGNWTQARFAYGRGSWRPPYTWKPIEKRFMSKADWTYFDKI